MNVMIVESPNKIKKIKGFLDGGWTVVASVGHIRDLPLKIMGIEPPDFVPTYEISEGKKDVVKRLKDAVKNAEIVYLAMDPDREGEAIAWHLKEALRLKKPHRISFQEITKKAVIAAINSPAIINDNLVKAQEARRVLDRLVGYTVSPVLCSLAGQKLSAGRVQSPAVRLVVDRDLEIEKFKPVTHFGVKIGFETDDIKWVASWDFIDHLKGGEKLFTDKSLAEKVAVACENNTATVAKIEKQGRTVKPPAPFTTSTLQQAASAALKMSPKQTMQAAQKLFEAGLITYHRTDSQNLSREAIDAIREFIAQTYGPEFVPEVPNTWKEKKGAQEAHEAIRPTHFDESPKLEGDECRLYDLIFNRAIACQMADAKFDDTVIDLLVSGQSSDPMRFKAKGSILIFPGWKKLTAKDSADESDEEKDIGLPNIEQGSTHDIKRSNLIEKQTKPPARYTQAGLIKKLESEGIGRPSTYAAIMENIMSREYITEEKRMLQSTDLGRMVVKTLIDAKFGFMDLPYTRGIEEDLDQIARGQKTYLALVTATHGQLETDLKNVPAGTGERQAKPALAKCPLCGGDIIENPKAFGCSNWKSASCKFTLWKEIAGRKLSIPEAQALIRDGKTGLLKGFKSKAKKPFAAFIVMEKSGKTSFEFEKKGG